MIYCFSIRFFQRTWSKFLYKKKGTKRNSIIPFKNYQNEEDKHLELIVSTKNNFRKSLIVNDQKMDLF